MSLPPEIADFMEKYGVTSDNVWLLPGGKKYAILHKELERVAANEGISFAKPEFIPSSDGVAMWGQATLNGRTVWTTGEAAARNCKNNYWYAMAEKRLKDRLTLKLLDAHGDIYSDSETDDFSDAGERSPPKEDAIEKAYAHAITCFVKNRKDAEEFYSKNKGMIQQLRVATRDRIIGQLKIISDNSNEEAAA